MKSSPGDTHTPSIPRAEVVQNLSLLIGFLEWVRPGAGNYKLCGRMRQVIKRILTRILNPPAQSVPSSQETATSAPPQQASPPATTVPAFDNSIFDPARYDDGLENLEWLNEIDWSRGPWIDLGGTGGQDFSAARWS